MKRERLDPKISAKLEGMDLWRRFNEIGTEMIITKVSSLRNNSFYFYQLNKVEMVVDYFQTIIFLLMDLNLIQNYTFLLDIVPMDDNRYKYQESAWVISGKSEPHMYGR